LQLRVRANARRGFTRSWCFRYQWRGEAVRIVIGHFTGEGRSDHMTLQAAREQAQASRKALDQGIDPRRASSRRRATPTPMSLSAAAVGEPHSVEALAAEFIERFLRPHRRRPEYAERILSHDVLSEWKGRDARSIKPREVIELLDKIVDRGRPVMANRVAAVLGQLFKFGVHRNIVETSPVQLLMRPGGKERPRERALSDDELKAFLRDPLACCTRARLAHALKVLLLTGARRGELVAARWSDIDFTAKAWTIRAEVAKTGQARSVPLSDWAVEEFRALKKLAKKSPWVLPGNGDGHIQPMVLTRGVARNLTRFEKQGIKAFHAHDLRRTCRTALSALKVEPHVAELVLGHKLPGMRGVYDVHSYATEQREALEKWSAHLRVISSAEA
jgi:integrase